MDAVYDIGGPGEAPRGMPRYGVVGLAVIVAAEILLFSGSGLVGMYFTPLVWTGYVLLADALNLLIHGRSLMTSRSREFLAMLPWSILCWCIFEAFNLHLQNWVYTGLPENLLLRGLGYAWAFATIFPAVLETSDFLRPYFRRRSDSATGLPRLFVAASIGCGIACLVAPLLVDRTEASRLFGLVWIGFFLLLDPLNHLRGGRSILADIRMKNYELPVSLILSGLVCGILWEFWNYWASAKWVYTIPISIAGPKLFEMPLLGYLGFIPFAFECWVMQESLRLLLSRKPAGRTA